jgi:hypothetical protein
MDIGSFILESDGIRWAGYGGWKAMIKCVQQNLWNYEQHSDLWTTFHLGPEGHNILQFNNARQVITGMADLKCTANRKRNCRRCGRFNIYINPEMKGLAAQ